MNVPGDILITEDKFYLDWALRTYGSKVLNIRPVRAGGQKFTQINTTVLKAIGNLRNEQTKLRISSAKLNTSNPNYGKTGVISSRTKIEVTDGPYTKTIFPSLTKAALALKTTSNTIKSHISDNTLRGEFKITRIGDISMSNRIEITDLLKNTNTTYDSIRKAALATGIGKATLCWYVNTDKVTVG